jgi:hypothetical protein
MEWILQTIQDYWAVFTAFLGTGTGLAIVLSILRTTREIAKAKGNIAGSEKTVVGALEALIERVSNAMTELDAFKTAYFSDPKHTGQLGVFERTKSKITRELQSAKAIAAAVKQEPQRKRKFRIKKAAGNEA